MSSHIPLIQSLDKISSHVYYVYMNEITDINASLPAQLVFGGKRTGQIIDERLIAVGLSYAQLWTLHSIVKTDTLQTLATVTCLADVMHTTKSNVTAMVDRLLAEKLVTRKSDEEDRRAVVIALTEEGQQRYLAGVEVIKAFHKELSELFSTEEKQFLSCLMDKLKSLP